MNYDYAALRHRIKASGMTHKTLAAEAGISEWQLSRKLAGKTEFTQGEILRISRALGVSTGDISVYFFREK